MSPVDKVENVFECSYSDFINYFAKPIYHYIHPRSVYHTPNPRAAQRSGLRWKIFSMTLWNLLYQLLTDDSLITGHYRLVDTRFNQGIMELYIRY